MNTNEKRIEVALEAVKQQITLSSGIITIIFTLYSRASTILDNNLFEIIFVVAIFSFTACVVFGIFTLLRISYSFYNTDDPFKIKGVRITGTSQAVSFILGVVLLSFSMIAASFA